MSACDCCERQFAEEIPVRKELFNWVSAALIAGWVMIVAVAAESASMQSGEAVSLGVFIEQLLR